MKKIISTLLHIERSKATHAPSILLEESLDGERCVLIDIE